jgi:hypothetical protein
MLNGFDANVNLFPLFSYAITSDSDSQKPDIIFCFIY